MTWNNLNIYMSRVSRGLARADDEFKVKRVNG